MLVSRVHDACARRMSDKSWSALQELVDDAYSFGRPTSRVERLWDWDRLPGDCNSFSFDPDSFGGNGIVCGSFGDITDLCVRPLCAFVCSCALLCALWRCAAAGARALHRSASRWQPPPNRHFLSFSSL